MSELAVGTELEPFVVTVDAGPMKTMAVLLRDPNPIHWDTAVTQRLGLGDRPINQGPLTMSYLLECLLRAAGGAEAVRSVSVRFIDNVLAGETVVCGGRVTAVDQDGDTAELELEASANGRPVLSGSATIALEAARG